MKDRLADYEKRWRESQLENDQLRQQVKRLEKKEQEANSLRTNNSRQGHHIADLQRKEREAVAEKAALLSRLSFAQVQLDETHALRNADRNNIVRLEAESRRDQRLRLSAEEEKAAAEEKARRAEEKAAALEVELARARALVSPQGEALNFLRVHIPISEDRIVDDPLIFPIQSSEVECYTDEANGVFCEHLTLSFKEGGFSLERVKVKKRAVRWPTEEDGPRAKRSRTE